MGGGLGKISSVHQHEAFVWQQEQEGSLNLVCDLKDGVSPQWLASPSQGWNRRVHEKQIECCPLLFILAAWLLYRLPLLYCETTWSCQRLSGDPGRAGQRSGTPYWMGCSW